MAWSLHHNARSRHREIVARLRFGGARRCRQSSESFFVFDLSFIEIRLQFANVQP